MNNDPSQIMTDGVEEKKCKKVKQRENIEWDLCIWKSRGAEIYRMKVTSSSRNKDASSLVVVVAEEEEEGEEEEENMVV